MKVSPRSKDHTRRGFLSGMRYDRNSEMVVYLLIHFPHVSSWGHTVGSPDRDLVQGQPTVTFSRIPSSKCAGASGSGGPGS
jgi:hypothetical protein